MKLELTNVIRKFAKHGKDAIEQINKHMEEGWLFQVILMDVDMPIMDGKRATKMIRQMEQEKGLQRQYIVGMVNDFDSTSIDELTNLGMNDVIEKPINPNIVNAQLKAALAFI